MALTRRISDDLDALAEHTLATLDHRFGLAPKPVSPQYRRKVGDWAGQPLVIETDIRLAGGPVAQVLTARITSPEDADAVSSLTVAVVPRCDTGAPIFGGDLISFRGQYSLVGLDVTPMGRALQAPTRARLAAARAPLERLGRRRAPGSPFGPDAVFVSPRKGERELPVAGYLAYLEGFLGEVTAPPRAVDEVEVRGAQDRYFRAMSTHMKDLPVLGKFFGPEWVATYFDDVFFDRLSIR